MNVVKGTSYILTISNSVTAVAGIFSIRPIAVASVFIVAAVLFAAASVPALLSSR